MTTNTTRQALIAELAKELDEHPATGEPRFKDDVIWLAKELGEAAPFTFDPRLDLAERRNLRRALLRVLRLRICQDAAITGDRVTAQADHLKRLSGAERDFDDDCSPVDMFAHLLVLLGEYADCALLMNSYPRTEDYPPAERTIVPPASETFVEDALNNLADAILCRIEAIDVARGEG